MKTYRVGIVGYGWAAEAHVGAINGTRNGRVTAVCSSRPLNSAQLSVKHGCPLAVYSDLDRMLADPDIDIIDICGYHHVHAKHAVAAAKAGKHLIIEKPLALSWEDCRAIEAAVAAAGVRTCVCFELRWSGQFQAIRSILDQGLLGDLHYGEVDYYHGIGPWYREYEWITTREGCGSALLEAGCHAVDALLMCMGTDIESVFSVPTQSKHPVFQKYEYPTTSVTIVRFRGGRVGKVASVIDCWQPYYFHTHLVGSEGSLLDNKFHSNRIAGLNRGRWCSLSAAPVDSGDVSDHPYQAQFQAFFDALGRGEEMPLTSLKDALLSHRLVFAADRSAATGQVVTL